MSEFDKEAERERLREKYEQDRKDREATQRMSDLLLKGARMTGTHCGTCGDPLFEQEETLFCPSCHGGPEGVEGTLQVDETTVPEESEPVEADPEPAAREQARPPEPESQAKRSPARPQGSAAENLQRALERFAAAAAATEDPREAREHLAAAREAAEALAALR